MTANGNYSIPIKSTEKHIEQNDGNDPNGFVIYHRVCEEPVISREDADSICECNRPERSHKAKATQQGNKKWEMIRHTKPEFSSLDEKTITGARFIRLAPDIPEARVEKLLLEVWQVPKPQLIISIIGEANHIPLSDRFEENFINGIIHVALKADAWLLTSGYNVGITQLVGQAINKAKIKNPKIPITAIGICIWGGVRNRFEVTGYRSDNDEATSDKKHHCNDRTATTQEFRKCQLDLEINHSHYLMVDDGRLRHFDIKDYRTRLCVKLAKLQDETDFPVPIVTVVGEGGRDTIKQIYYDLRENIPIVIIDGSGRVADLFKKWLRLTKEFENYKESQNIKYEINQIVEEKSSLMLTSTGSEYADFSGSKPEPRTIEITIDAARNVLQEMFVKYSQQLKVDLEKMFSNNNQQNIQCSASVTEKPDHDSELIGGMAEVMYCLQPSVRSSITVTTLNAENELSETIFRSICKARQQYFERKEANEKDDHRFRTRRAVPQFTKQQEKRVLAGCQEINDKGRIADQSKLLNLTMDWNHIDVAKELVLKNSLDNIWDKDQAFINAIKEDLPAFVYEFLKLGISPSEAFSTKPEDEKCNDPYDKLFNILYNADILKNPKTHLSLFIQTVGSFSNESILKRSALNAALTCLIGDFMQNLYFDECQRPSGNSRNRIAPDNEKATLHERSTAIVEENHRKKIIRDYIIRDLFLWSLLMNRIKLAKVLLSYSKHRICSALIATKVLKAYYMKAAHGELKYGYLKEAQWFEQYAIDCITKCEEYNADQACQIVVQRIELYGNVTCLQIASAAGDKLFIATPCCVQAMNNIWYDKIYPKESKSWDFTSFGIAFISLGLLAPLTLTYRNDIQSVNKESSQPRLEPYGIDYCDPDATGSDGIFKKKWLNLYINKVKHFHLSLRTKFAYHLIAYIFFLLLFSYVLLFEFQPPTFGTPSIHGTEIVTIILVSCMLIEEFHYFSTMDELTFSAKISSYFSKTFKLMTFTGFVLFYIGLILRFSSGASNDQFTAARIIMAIDVEIWWLRSLSFVIVQKSLGPHLVAIGKMLKDLAFFICIIFIVMAGYGVASRSMAYYPNASLFSDTNINTDPDGRSTFRQIIYPVYYLMYGQFGNELSDLDQHPDAAWSISTHILLAMHMFFVNILLMNLLIAMFSKRFDQVYEDTQNVWHSQQYLFTREYYSASPLLPPFSAAYDLHFLLKMLFHAIKRFCFKGVDYTHEKTFKMIPVTEQCIKDWHQFEAASTYECTHAVAKTVSMASCYGEDQSTVGQREENIDQTEDSDALTNILQQIQENIETLKKSFEDMKGKPKK